jgi:hypothetical protein
MQVKDILNKLRSLEEADEKEKEDEKDSKRKVDPTNGAGEGDPFAASAINSTRTKPETGSSGNKPKFEPDPTGLDGAAGDKPKFEPDPTGLDGAAGDMPAKSSTDAGGSTGAAGAAAAGAAVAQAVKDPNSKVAQQVNKELGTPTEANPEVEKLVLSLDAIDKFLKKYVI